MTPLFKRMSVWCRRTESGQALVFVALVLVVLLGMLALVIDGGNLMAQRRSGQNAADAAALAAAYKVASLSTDAAVRSSMTTYATSNDADGATGVYLPSGMAVGGGSVPSGTTSVRVTVSQQVTMAFASLLGMPTATVRASATAQLQVQSPGCGGRVVWGHSNTCSPAFSFTGSGGWLDGTVHSNTSVVISGSGHVISGPTEYVTSFSKSGTGHTVTPVQVPYAATWPATFNIADYAPGGRAALAAQAVGKYYTHSDSTWSTLGSGKTITEGLHYCYNNASISGSGHTGHITIVAEGKIELIGSAINLTHYSDGLLFFSNRVSSCTANNAINISGSGLTLAGVVYAPRGWISDSGSGSMFGSLIAWNVTVSGSGHRTYVHDICTSQPSTVVVHLVH